MSARWDVHFMRAALNAAIMSKDPTTKVGCVIVDADRCQVSTGFNGLPRGVRDHAERMERPIKYLWTSHAEENAVAQAARFGHALKGCTAYVTHRPCARCARSLIQAGIVCVVVGDGTTAMPADEFEVAASMFLEAGVKVREAGA